MEYGNIRTIQDDLVISPSMPRLVVRINPDLIYLGDLEYIRRETQEVEEFVFINPSGRGHVTQLLLIHFEGFLENRPGAYRYRTSPVVELDGEPYIYDAFTVDIQEYIRQQHDSVVARAADYIQQRAYTLTGQLTFQRFRRPVSDDQRNEFSVLYAFLVEDGADSQPGPQVKEEDPSTWPPAENALAYFSIFR